MIDRPAGQVHLPISDQPTGRLSRMAGRPVSKPFRPVLARRPTDYPVTNWSLPRPLCPLPKSQVLRPVANWSPAHPIHRAALPWTADRADRTNWSHLSLTWNGRPVVRSMIFFFGFSTSKSTAR